MTSKEFKQRLKLLIWTEPGLKLNDKVDKLVDEYMKELKL